MTEAARLPEVRYTSVNELLAHRAGSASTALIDDGIEISWQELVQKSRAVASGFAELGVGPGDRVAIWLPNRAAWLISFFACAQLGAIAVSINTRFRSAEVSDLLFRSGARLLIYWPDYKDIDFSGILGQCPAESLTHLRNVIVYTEADRPIANAVAGKPVTPYGVLLKKAPLRQAPGTAASPCAIFTTSGTTKAPKLVVHKQENVLRHGFNVARQYGLVASDKFLLLPPFCGVYGFCSAMAALVAGVPLILSPTWNPALFADLIERHAITHFTASNEALAQLLDVRAAGRVFPSLKFVVSANLNPAHADIAARAERVGIEVVGLYGSSEVQALFSMCDREATADIRGRAGGSPASREAIVRVRDSEAGTVCKAGEAGELEIYAPESRFVEYFGNEAATREAITADGYFRTGDLGVIEADGSFTFMARMGDVLRLGGFLVSPAEIEELIQEMPSVQSCQIVGVELGGSLKPIAFVIPRDGARIDEQQVISYVAARLAKYKVPARVFTIDEFPITPSANGSKVQKTRLREIAERQLKS